jgi:cytochrome c peroxidase
MKKIIIGLCVLGIAGYNVSASAKHMHVKQKHLDKKLTKIINSQSLTGDPLLNRDVPDINSPQAQLGMELFFSKTLGGDQDSACVACHHPALGGGDNLSLPIGVEADEPDLLGSGRSNYFAANNPEGGPPVPRNAPTTFNVVAWDKFQFHDGRVESLDPTPGANGASSSGIRTPNSEFGVADPLAGNNLVQVQARFPVTSREEMKGFNHDTYTDQTIRELLAGRLGGYGAEDYIVNNTDYWLDMFRTALASPNGDEKELITEQNISMLIGEYERSQAFVNTPWKKYVEGDKQSISVAAKKGALIFYMPRSRGGADCSSCHRGDFFTDESFHNLAMPQIGPGKGDGVDGSKDFGRARETGLERDKFAFRTPSLLNVEVTGPWSHAGAYTTLEAVIKHHANAANTINHYDESQLLQVGILNLDKMLENTEEALYARSFALKPLHLSRMKVGFLVEFLKTLTDPCTKDRACLSQWIPDEADRNDPNDDHLYAVDENGNLL